MNWVPEGDLKAAFLDLNLEAADGETNEKSDRNAEREWHEGDGEEGAGTIEVDDDWLLVSKPPGRRSTRFMMEGDDEVEFFAEGENVAEDEEPGEGGGRRGLLQGGRRKGGMMMDVDSEGQDHSHDRRRRGRRAHHRSEDDAVGLSHGERLSDRKPNDKRGGQTSSTLPEAELHSHHRRRALHGRGTVTSLMGAEALWKQGFSGKGVRVGVFDTGIQENHPHIRNIKDRSNWTHQNSLSDGLGHGSFVAGEVIVCGRLCCLCLPHVAQF